MGLTGLEGPKVSIFYLYVLELYLLFYIIIYFLYKITDSFTVTAVMEIISNKVLYVRNKSCKDIASDIFPNHHIFIVSTV